MNIAFVEMLYTDLRIQRSARSAPSFSVIWSAGQSIHARALSWSWYSFLGHLLQGASPLELNIPGRQIPGGEKCQK